MKKTLVRIFSIILSVFVILSSAACTGCSSAAELSVSVAAEINAAQPIAYCADDGQLLLTAECDGVTFSNGENGAAEQAAADLAAFIEERDALDGSGALGDTGLDAYLSAAQEEYMQAGADGFSPRVFERMIVQMRADEAVLSFRFFENIREEDAETSASDARAATYAVSFDALTGQRLTLDDIALSGIDLADYAAAYVVSYIHENYSDMVYDGMDEWVGENVCADGSWYFDESGITFIYRPGSSTDLAYDLFLVTIQYTELVKVVKSEYIPETASMGLEPFGEGFLGGDNVDSVSGIIVSVEKNRLTLKCDNGGTAVLLLADKDNQKYAEQLIGCEVDIVYYVVTSEVAAITAAE